MRYYPTDRQICLSVLLAIATHPFIQNPPVYYPVAVAGETPEQMKITKFRDYAGLELPEPGLTLSVFPTPRGDYAAKSSIEFTPYTLGNTEPGEYLDKGDLSITVQLALINADFDTAYNVKYQVELPLFHQPHGTLLRHYETDTQDAADNILNNPITAPKAEVEISTLPAEMVLREYMTLLRSVVRDARVFQPYSLRNPVIKYVNYPTVAPIGGEARNLVFHQADMVLGFDLYESNIARASGYLDYLSSIQVVEVADPVQTMHIYS